MNWFAALLTRANGNGALSALLGGAKVYPEEAPQGVVLPYVILTDVTESRPQNLTGFDLEVGRVQVDVWTTSYATKNTIMDAVLTAVLPGGQFGAHRFCRAMIELGPRDIPRGPSDPQGIFRKSADLIIHHSPA